ncbi:VanZ family protein [Streptomyces sp. NPDC059819]|uniref:VanZ family protein n=1 Tax=Streptomyces sp. NPDC059819 TaxID=3346963 RepID=UPI00365C2B3C
MVIRASIGAVPGLIPSFLILAGVLAGITALISRARNRPLLLPVLLATCTAALCTVTLLPGAAGMTVGQCDTGLPVHVFTSSSSLLNIGLFIPPAALSTLLFRRPATVAAVFVLFSGLIEFIQSVTSLGRSCTVTDVVANSIGALVGVGGAAVWLGIGGRALRRPLRDFAWAAGIALSGSAALAYGFNSQVTGVNVVAIDDSRRAVVDATEGSDTWLSAEAEAVFGTGTRSTGTQVEKDGSRWKIIASTDRGTISGWWPDRTLEWASASDQHGDAGTLTAAQAGGVARSFARTHFPDSLAGSDQTVRTLDDGPHAAYLVTYRRHRQGVLMPMRLDFTITRSGRIIGFTSEAVRDPVPPRATVTVTGTTARRQPAKTAGAEAASAQLLARQLDGVTGQRVAPDKWPDGQGRSAPGQLPCGLSLLALLVGTGPGPRGAAEPVGDRQPQPLLDR